MGNVLEFYLKMKDMMSSGLVKVAATAKSSFAQVEQAVKSATGKMKSEFTGLEYSGKRMNSSLATMKENLRQINFIKLNTNIKKEFDAATKAAKTLGAEISQLEGKKSGGGGGMMGGLLKRFAPAAIGAAALSFGTTSVKAAMEFGATKKSFEVLTGSRQKGGDLTNSLNSLQQNTILGPEVFKAAQTMLGFGVAQEKVVSISKQLGDVSMGNKEKFESLALVYSQTQASGKLMGQDLLQYINAGFNPLTIMSEKWKEFGFAQKQSVGQLKEAMEKGKISSDMVAKAFEMATSSGGKFNGMMNAIAETSYGKAQIMAGQWENFKVQAGDALMPVASGLMEVASKTLSWINISKTAPQVLAAEKYEVIGLVKTITGLNEGNATRTLLLEKLKNKYPDLFSNLDIEKVKNTELLQTLDSINSSYNKRIELASTSMLADQHSQKYKEAMEMQSKAAMVAQHLRDNPEGSMGDVLTIPEQFSLWQASGGSMMKFGFNDNADYYDKLANKLGKTAGDENNEKAKYGQRKNKLEILELVKKGQDMMKSNPKQWMELFNKNGGEENFNSVYAAAQQGSSEDLLKIQKFFSPSVSPSSIKGGDTPTKDKKSKASSDAIGSSITGGGPRVINIHGVKFADKIELHAASVTETAEELQKVFDDMFLRTLNSGASVQ